MIKSTENILKKLYCDKYDSNLVSYLSLFLYGHIRILLAKDVNQKVVAVHTWNLLASAENPISNVWKDSLYQMDVPTKVFVHNQLFSLVPGVLYQPDFMSTYLSFAGGTETDFQSFTTSLETNNYQLIGGLDSRLFHLLSEGKSNIQFHHGASSFLAYCLKEKQSLLPQEIFIYLFDKAFYIAAFNKQELVLFNRFDIGDKESLLNYVFGITQQLKFDRKHCRYTVFGEIKNYGITENWGQEYFKNFLLKEPEINQHYHQETEAFKKTAHFESHWEHI